MVLCQRTCSVSTWNSPRLPGIATSGLSRRLQPPLCAVEVHAVKRRQIVNHAQLKVSVDTLWERERQDEILAVLGTPSRERGRARQPGGPSVPLALRLQVLSPDARHVVIDGIRVGVPVIGVCASGVDVMAAQPANLASDSDPTDVLASFERFVGAVLIDVAEFPLEALADVVLAVIRWMRSAVVAPSLSLAWLGCAKSAIASVTTSAATTIAIVRRMTKSSVIWPSLTSPEPPHESPVGRIYPTRERKFKDDPWPRWSWSRSIARSRAR